MSRTNWGELLHLAVTQFSLSPAEFWRLSVWEWQQIISAPKSSHANTANLQALRIQFPDVPNVDEEEIKNG